MLIRSKAPFRISFGGGGTDMPPYCTEHGGCVISTTIDRHVHITIEPRQDNKFKIFSVNFNKEFSFDIGDKDYSENFELFKGVVNVLDIKNGFNITTYSELPTGSGMGGSSSLCVALIGAFNEYFNLGLSKHEIAQKACEIERIELKQKGGYQDQFAASFGGFNFIEFSDKVNVHPIETTNQI
ncbi:MAG: GHMP kinase, partial [Candidatus Hermodarchaeota archaeon]